MRYLFAIALCLPFTGCHSEAIRDTAQQAIVTLTDEQRALASEVVAAVGELVHIRDTTYEQLATIAGMTDDEIVQEALQECAERMADGMTERLKALALRLQQHAAVLQEVIRQLHQIHQWAIDQINIMAWLNAPASFFGIPPFTGGGGSPTTPTPPGPTPQPGGRVPWPEIITTMFGSYAAYRGGKAVWDKRKKKKEDERAEAEKSKARDEALAATMQMLRAQTAGGEVAKPDPDQRAVDTFLEQLEQQQDPAMSQAGITLPSNGARTR